MNWVVNNDPYLGFDDDTQCHSGEFQTSQTTNFEHYSVRNYMIRAYVMLGEVGGIWVPVDKLALLAPYIALASTIILAVSISVVYIKYRKKQ